MSTEDNTKLLVFQLLLAALSFSASYAENVPDDFIDLSEFSRNAFIEPDTEITGRLVAEYKKDSQQNPEELGAYFEGDIRIPLRIDTRNALTAKSYRWEKGIVPYEISGSFNAKQLATINWAFQEFHKETCIRFKPRSKEKDYVSIVNGNSGCWAVAGRIGGKQEVNLQTPACLWQRGVVVHELMHAVGVMHEHCRHDRDNYVTINTQNIEKNKESNFKKTSKSNAHGMGIDYDYGSVMHYSPKSFSKNGKVTIEAKKDTEEAKLMGQRDGFSRADIAKLNLMYKC